MCALYACLQVNVEGLSSASAMNDLDYFYDRVAQVCALYVCLKRVPCMCACLMCALNVCLVRTTSTTMLLRYVPYMCALYVCLM